MSADRARASSGPVFRWFNLAAGFRWWGRGLLLWLPKPVRQLFARPPVLLVIEPTSTEVIVAEEKGGRRKELARHSLAEFEAATMRLPSLQNRRLVLRLNRDGVLSKNTTLPMAAENKLHQVVGYEIDRLTPFTADKLYFDAVVVERRPEDRTLIVQFSAALRSTVDEMIRQLGQLGATPDVIDVAGGTAQVNLLPPTRRPRRGRATRALRNMLLILVVLTGAAVAAIPVWQQRGLAIELLPKVDASQRAAQSASELRSRLETEVDSSQFLVQKRSTSIPVIDLINELTLLLPDNTWVEQLIIKNGEVQVRGQSRDATSLISIVEGSQFFSQATFRSPVTPDRRTGADRFFLTARVNVGPRIQVIQDDSS